MISCSADRLLEVELLLDGRRILVSGATGALGEAVVRELEAQRAQVVAWAGPSAPSHGVDLRDEAAVDRALESALQDGPIDGAALLAGGYRQLPLGSTQTSDMDTLMGLNLYTAIPLARRLLPMMAEAGRGRLVAVGAYAVQKASAKQAAYNASKAALVTYFRTAAEEYRSKGDIAVVTLLPTTLDTPANRLAMPGADPGGWVKLERLAALIAFLMSDAAGDLNGASIPVRGRL